ncbi:DnaA regulatory inactivator Hda [Thiohalorhabdus methylotrophus]|uniref:DnaA regulatory inactivator Hda n=1 Tax=Thiohalorhabdus methylotrophus TaxID=3242694 RepID=A0ABV4TS87_9GAMM
MAGQLPLVLDRPDRHRLELFEPGEAGREAWSRVQAVVRGEERFVFIWGERGSGKTHLLEGAARAAGGSYLDLASMHGEVSAAGLDPERVLDPGLAPGLVALDGVEAVAGDDAWEAAVFHLYNQVNEEDGRLLAAANANPNSLGLLREELRTRLHWGGSYLLGRLADGERLEALRRHAEARGLTLKDEVGRFLLRHYSRNLHQLVAALEQLDAAALAERRRLTVPFVKARLGL